MTASLVRSPGLFRSILVYLKAVISMVLILPFIFNSVNLFSKPLGTVSSILTIIGMTVTSMFSIFKSSGKIPLFVNLFAFFHFLSAKQQNPPDDKLFFFLLINSTSGHLARIGLYLSPRKIIGLIKKNSTILCHYHLLA